MKILAIITAKNEEDIIEHAVLDALSWADYIVALDNNSMDRTAEILKELSAVYDQVYFWGKYEGPFHDWLRSLVFNDYKYLINPGDWVCRLDADEFYIDNPKVFLAELPKNTDVVYSASFQYYFTDKDLESDLSLPAQQRMKYYSCNHSEERFFQFKEDTFWPISRGWPLGLINIADKRIRLKHFQYRTQAQMAKRFETRQQVNISKINTNLFMHENTGNKVFEATALTFDNGVYEIDEKKIPEIPSNDWRKQLKNKLVKIIFNIQKIREAVYPPTNTRIK